LDDLAAGKPGHKPIHPQYLARIVSETAAEDAAFTADDVGTPAIWAARYLKMNGKRRLVGSWAHGSMANAMAHGIGIQAAQPGRQVVSLSGDGGFTMLMGDLISLTQLKLLLKVVIFNNGFLGFVALEMKAACFVDTNVDLQNPISRPWRVPWALTPSGWRTRSSFRAPCGTSWPMTASAARRRNRGRRAFDAADDYRGRG